MGLAESRAVLAGMLPRDVPVPAIVGASASTRSPSSPAIDSLMTRATFARAELRALQQLAVQAHSEAEAARRARLPSAHVVGGLKRRASAAGRDTGGVFGLNLSLPLFDAGGRESARWDAERLRLGAERTAIETRIRSEIASASEILALRQTAVARQQTGAADELVQIAVVAYREGEVGILELLDAVRTASRAQIRSIDLQLGARLAEIALERAVGETLWP